MVLWIGVDMMMQGQGTVSKLLMSGVFACA